MSVLKKKQLNPSNDIGKFLIDKAGELNNQIGRAAKAGLLDRVQEITNIQAELYKVGNAMTRDAHDTFAAARRGEALE